MIGIIVKRLIQGVPTVFGVTLITFILFNVVGGDPVTHYLGKSANPKEVELMKKEYGLDQPLINQYTDFLEEVVTLTLDGPTEHATRSQKCSLTASDHH